MKRIIWGLVFLLLVLAAWTPAHARVRMTPDIALWRLLAHEASLPIRNADDDAWVSRRTGRLWGDDVFIIHEVLLRGVERTGEDYVTFAQMYAHRMFEPLSPVERTRVQLGLPLDGNRWAGFLDVSLRRPQVWTGTAWSENRAAAEYALEVAREMVQVDLRMLEEFSPCAEPVDDWGGRMDGDRARALGLIEVDCGPNVANTGYARPSQIRARLAAGTWPPVDPD